MNYMREERLQRGRVHGGSTEAERLAVVKFEELFVGPIQSGL